MEGVNRAIISNLSYQCIKNDFGFRDDYSGIK